MGFLAATSLGKLTSLAPFRTIAPSLEPARGMNDKTTKAKGKLKVLEIKERLESREARKTKRLIILIIEQ